MTFGAIRRLGRILPRERESLFVMRDGKRTKQMSGARKALRAKPFEVISHTADKGMVARGATLEDLLINAAKGMFSLVADPDLISLDREEKVTAEGEDREALLVNFLSELLFLFDARREIFKSFDIIELDAEADGTLKVTAVARGCRYDGLYPSQLKAVTWHNLAVREVPGGLEATVIFDV
jgi:SHS2 domain-containing protein